MASQDYSETQDPFLPKSNMYSQAPLFCWGMCTKRGMICSSVAWLLALLTLLLTIFLGAESIAQVSINDSSIYMYQMTMKSFTSNSIVTDIQSGMDNRSPFKATIKKTNFDLRYNGKTFGEITFPKISLDTGKITEIDFDDQKISVKSVSAFNEFSYDLLTSKSLTMALHGKVPLSTNGLHYKLSTSQDIKIAGMQNLSAPGFEPFVEEITFGETTSDIIQFTMLVQIYNPSIVEFDDIEGMNFTMLYVYNGARVEIGYAVCTNDTIPLNVGYNYYLMQSVVTRNTDNNPAVQDMLSSFAEGKTQTFTMQGNENTTPIKLLQSSMSKIEMSITFSGLSVLRTGSLPQDYYTPATFAASPIGPIFNRTLGSYVLNRPLFNLKTLYQAVFADLNVFQIVSTSDIVNCNYTDTNLFVDTVLLIYNPMNATMEYYEWGVHVYMELNFTASSGTHYDNPLFGIAKSPLNHSSSEPVFSIPPLSSAFYSQRVCLTGSTQEVSDKSFYLYGMYGASKIAFPLNFMLAGAYNVKIGKFDIVIPYNQTVRAYNAFS
jgi:hypothetical protein